MARRTDARRTRWRCLALAPLVASLTACSGGDVAEADDESLDQYLKLIFSDDLAAQRALQAEEAVAACMAEQGFEYVPAVRPDATVRAADFPIEWGSAEFAQQYGYGITTDPWGSAGLLPEPTAWTDPNAAYVAGLTPAERAAYEEAMLGNPESDDLREQGCPGRASYEVHVVGFGGHFEALQESAAGLGARMEADERVRAARQVWTWCLLDAGYPQFDHPTDAYNWVIERSNEAASASADGDATAADMAAEVRRAELELAIADLRCAGESGTIRIEEEVLAELEVEFLETHRDELEAWIEASEDLTR